MLEYLKENTEFIETFKRKTILYKGELTYYHFKIGDTHYMLSCGMTDYYVLTDYIVETQDTTKYVALGNKNTIINAIKKLKEENKCDIS